MSAKLWRRENQNTSARRNRMLAEYKARLSDPAFTAQECNEYYSTIPQLTTKRQARMNTSEEKIPSRLLTALLDRCHFPYIPTKKQIAEHVSL